MPRRPHNTTEPAACHGRRGTHLEVEQSILYFRTRRPRVDGERRRLVQPRSNLVGVGSRPDGGARARARSGRGPHNLRSRTDLVINLPEPSQWRAVERLAPMTGRHPVPETKAAGCRFERDKFAAARLDSSTVPPGAASHRVPPPARGLRRAGAARRLWRLCHRRGCRPRGPRRPSPRHRWYQPHRPAGLEPARLQLSPLLRPWAGTRTFIPHADTGPSIAKRRSKIPDDDAFRHREFRLLPTSSSSPSGVANAGMRRPIRASHGWGRHGQLGPVPATTRTENHP